MSTGCQKQEEASCLCPMGFGVWFGASLHLIPAAPEVGIGTREALSSYKAADDTLLSADHPSATMRLGFPA